MTIWDNKSDTTYRPLGRDVAIQRYHKISKKSPKNREYRRASYEDSKFTCLWRCRGASFLDKKYTSKTCLYFQGFFQKMISGTSWSVFCGHKIHTFFTRAMWEKYCFEFWFIEPRQWYIPIERLPVYKPFAPTVVVLESDIYRKCSLHGWTTKF